MTEFSTYLSQVVNRRGLKCVQAAEICEIDTSVMFRWLNGRVLPKSWERLQQAAQKLRLSPHEMAGLKKAYRKEVLGEEQSRSFDVILELIQSLGEAKSENSNQTVNMPFVCEIHLRPIADGEKFLKLSNKTAVWLCIENVLAAMPISPMGKLLIKLNDLPEIFLMQLKQLCSRMSAGKLELLIIGSSIEDTAQYKLIRLKELVALLLAGSKNKISCYSLWNVPESVKQNWMLLDDIFLQFSEDMSQGMMTKDAEWADFFRENFEEMKDRCRPLERKETGFFEFLNGKKPDNPERIVFLQYMPYGSIAAAQRILKEDDFYKNPKEVQYISCFTKEGLAEYLQTGDEAGLPDSSICSLDRRQRYQALGQMISLAEQETAVHYIMFKENTLDLRGICVKCDSIKSVSLCLEICPEESKWEEIAINDADIRQEFERFFECLPESGLAYGEEETLKVMKEMVQGYCDGNKDGVTSSGSGR